jgi:peptidoglycan L-alanyl-D-glutamate endopeptidase CwlK
MKINRNVDDLLPKMQRVVRLADVICRRYGLPFEVFETLRTPKRQIKLFKEGRTKTLKSRHLLGEAVDIVYKGNGKWSWDFPRYKKEWYTFAFLLEHYSKKILKIELVWGGAWRGFPDFAHWQLKEDK